MPPQIMHYKGIGAQFWTKPKTNGENKAQVRTIRTDKNNAKCC